MSCGTAANEFESHPLQPLPLNEVSETWRNLPRFSPIFRTSQGAGCLTEICHPLILNS
jgi:hypothetical protein